MSRRHEISDGGWEIITPLLPPPNKKGRPRADDRQTFNGIVYVLRTGCAWMDMPERYGSYVTCWRRLRDWTHAGIWERIWQSLLGQLDEQGKIEWERGLLDGSFVAAKKGALKSA
jgi:transposase